MNRNINESIVRLTRKIIAFDCIILLVLTSLVIAFSSRSKQRLAEQFSEAFRTPLMAGDNREILLDMARPVSMDFIGFVWKPQNPSAGFAVPEDLGQPNWLLYQSAKVGIFFDENRSVWAGDVEFYYNRWTPLPAALASWLFLVFLSVTAGYFERKRMLREYALFLESGINESKANLAAQVAHDIRSPVFALDAALKDMTKLPEKQRVIVRHAVNRIRDVANSLLEKNRQQPGTASTTSVTGNISGVPLDVYLLTCLIDPIITEKHLQFESKPDVCIDFELTPEAYGLFANLDPVEFRRMLSNLVNNAVEALGDKGMVRISLAQKEEDIVLTVFDTGKGIPPEILKKLGQRGETYGKAGGSGLGLFHARTTAENWGGSLAITSELGKGVTVAIKLPKAETPSYFARELKLAPGCPVLVLDDDPGLHDMWRDRCETIQIKEYDIEVLNFNEPGQLRAWVKGNPEKASKAICLFDYELTGYKETGLRLAEELGLCGQTILVSSHSEEQPLIAACTALKVRMIPKGLADFVPISIVSHPPRAVLLDDSTVTQMTWEIAAEEAGVELLAYTAPDKFMADLDKFPKDMPIYIDSELGEDVKGEKIAEDLKGKGFTNICLATAHPPEKFAHLPWLKVRSKEAPWVNRADSATE